MTTVRALTAGREPWPQQEEGFAFVRDLDRFALFMEQRTGKSRIIVAKAIYEFERGRIDALLIISPSGVHLNWPRESLAEFLPPDVPHKIVAWRTGRMETKTAKAELQDLLEFRGLAILSGSYDALRTATFKKYLAKFVRKRKLMCAADEADDISIPGSKRSKTAHALTKWGVVNAVLTGTPAAESPFSLYSITNFLQPRLLGFSTFLAFKHHHGVYPRNDDGEIVKYQRQDGQEFEALLRDGEGRPMYQNLEELNRKLAAFSFFKTRSECGGKLPTLSERRFELSAKQREVYQALEEEFRAEISAGAVVSARHVLARWTRLQQVASGFVPLDNTAMDCPACAGIGAATISAGTLDGRYDCDVCDGLGLIVPDDRVAELPNPRLDALERELKGVQGHVVIWTRFRHDADAIAAWMRAEGKTHARYDGSVEGDEREMNKLAFQRGEVQHMLASPQAGGRGLDFSIARTAIFYSHHWSLRLRLQAQDRVENLGRTDPVCLINLVADETKDEDITGAHAAKRNVQDVITGRRREEWI